MDTDFENAKKLVEATIRKLGPRPGDDAWPADGRRQAAWTLKRGSASVLVTVTRHEDEDETLPAGRLARRHAARRQGQHGALFRRLLELNAAGLANAAFGLMGDRVVAVSERPADGARRRRRSSRSSPPRGRRRHVRRSARERVRRDQGLNVRATRLLAPRSPSLARPARSSGAAGPRLRARDAEVTSDTAAQFYDVRSPTGETVLNPPPPHDDARRRAPTTCSTARRATRRAAELSFRARVRYDADYGVERRRDRPDATRQLRARAASQGRPST